MISTCALIIGVKAKERYVAVLEHQRESGDIHRAKLRIGKSAMELKLGELLRKNEMAEDQVRHEEEMGIRNAHFS